MRLVALVGLAVSLLAAPVKAEMPTWSWSVEVLSRYAGGPNMANASSRAVVQNSITATWQSGCFVNLWTSNPLRGGAVRDEGSYEIDWTGGCGGKIGVFDYIVGAAYFDLAAPTLFATRGDIVQVFGELSHTVRFGDHVFTPYVRVEPSWIVGSTEKDGVWTHIGIRHEWIIVPDLVSLLTAGRVVYDPGVYSVDPGFNFRFDAALGWRLDRQVSLRLPIFRAFTALGGPFEDGRTTKFVVGSGLDVKF